MGVPGVGFITLTPDFWGLDDPGPDTHGSPDEAARLHRADDFKKEEAPGEAGTLVKGLTSMAGQTAAGEWVKRIEEKPPEV